MATFTLKSVMSETFIPERHKTTSKQMNRKSEMTHCWLLHSLSFRRKKCSSDSSVSVCCICVLGRICWCDVSSAVKSVPRVHCHISLSSTCVKSSCLLLHAVLSSGFLFRKSKIGQRAARDMSVQLSPRDEFVTKLNSNIKCILKIPAKMRRGKSGVIIWLSETWQVPLFFFFFFFSLSLE